jgi:branched-chain amino acid transport system permease protein
MATESVDEKLQGKSLGHVQVDAVRTVALRQSGRFPLWSLVVLFVGVVTLPLYVDKHLLSVAIITLQMCYMAQCWNIATGYAGQFSLGHSVFFGIGGYTSTLLFVKLGVTPWLGMFAGAALAGIAGTFIALLVFRYQVRGIYFAVLTLGAMFVAKGVADNWEFIGGPVGVLITFRDDPANFLFLDREPYYFIILAMVIVMIFVTWMIERSKFGQYLIAVREDEEAAEASGVDTYKFKTVALAVSGALTAFAGTFYAQLYVYISPETMLSFEPQLNMMLGTMVGGAGTIAGPILGSIVMGTIAEALRNLPFEESRQVVSASKMIYGVLLMVIVIYFPRGLVGLFSRWRGGER